MALHVALTLFAFRVLPLVALLLAASALLSGVWRRRVSVAWSVLTVVLIAYVAVLGWGPSLATQDALVFYVIAQKVVVVVAVGTVYLVSLDADRLLHRQSGLPR